jgi:1,4-alpha-glucan branching enzyme
LGSIKRNVDLFVCPSEHLRDSAESLGFTPAEFISLGIDDQFKEEPNSVRERPLKVLYVGALVEQKGVHVLLDAFRSVLIRVPDAQLVIAGRGIMSESLRKQAMNNGIGDRVKFLGFVEHSKIAHLYRQAAVLAVPSIWKEQFGLTGPEAMACGTPCVGSDFGGIPEWLHNRKWGFTVSPRNPEALADRIVVLLKNRDLHQEFSDRGRVWALKQYSPDKYRENRLRLVEKFAKSAG